MLHQIDNMRKNYDYVITLWLHSTKLVILLHGRSHLSFLQMSRSSSGWRLLSRSRRRRRRKHGSGPSFQDLCLIFCIRMTQCWCSLLDGLGLFPFPLSMFHTSFMGGLDLLLVFGANFPHCLPTHGLSFEIPSPPFALSFWECLKGQL